MKGAACRRPAWLALVCATLIAVVAAGGASSKKEASPAQSSPSDAVVSEAAPLSTPSIKKHLPQQAQSPRREQKGLKKQLDAVSLLNQQTSSQARASPQDPHEEMELARRKKATAEEAKKAATAAQKVADGVYAKAKNIIATVAAARKVANARESAEQTKALQEMRAARSATTAARSAMANARYAIRNARREAKEAKSEVDQFLSPESVARAKRHEELREEGLQTVLDMEAGKGKSAKSKPTPGQAAIKSQEAKLAEAKKIGEQAANQIIQETFKGKK